MNIFLTGGSGFLGQSILSHLSKNYTIVAPTSSELDLVNSGKLKEFMKKNDFQYIINCAVRGGRRTRQDTEKDFYTNVKILDNILEYVSKDRKLITFSSGAEVYNPNGFYGFSKKICTSLIKDKDYIKNLRIYNLFGELGMKDSFIYTVVGQCLRNEDIIIWDDKLFDICYIDDLIWFIDKLIKINSSEYQEIDCVYEKKYKLSEIAYLIISLVNSDSKIIIENNNNLNYIGTYSNTLLVTPLETSLKKIINHIMCNNG